VRRRSPRLPRAWICGDADQPLFASRFRRSHWSCLLCAGLNPCREAGNRLHPEGERLGASPTSHSAVPVKTFKETIRQADAVLIATPEYDYAIPGVLTNALDWALRQPSPFRHKPVGIVGTSPGSVGTARGQMVLRQILLHPPAYVMLEPQMLIPFALQRFDQQTGDLVDERTRERMRRFLVALLEWSRRFEVSLSTHERSG
jgi:NAD(P)H-dependent FMN reductase